MDDETIPIPTRSNLMNVNKFGGRDAIFTTWRRGRRGPAIFDLLRPFVLLDANVVTAHTNISYVNIIVYLQWSQISHHTDD